MWDLVTEYDWFKYDLVAYSHEDRRAGVSWEDTIRLNPSRKMSVHEVVQLVERAADNKCDALSWKYAQSAWMMRWSAEADTFDSARPEYVGSEFRYSIAACIEGLVSDMPSSCLLIRKRSGNRERSELHPKFDIAICELFREMIPNPQVYLCLDMGWLTSDVRDVARHIYEDCAFETMPILGDALMDAGCENVEILRHCQKANGHHRGCWVLDWILENERSESRPV